MDELEKCSVEELTKDIQSLVEIAAKRRAAALCNDMFQQVAVVFRQLEQAGEKLLQTLQSDDLAPRKTVTVPVVAMRETDRLDRLLTTSEAAKLLGVSTQMVRQHVVKGRLKVATTVKEPRCPRSPRYRAYDVAAVLQAKSNGTIRAGNPGDKDRFYALLRQCAPSFRKAMKKFAEKNGFASGLKKLASFGVGTK